jgi:hypothetical protein
MHELIFMYHLEPIITKRGDAIVRYLNEYLRQYKNDSIVAYRIMRRRMLNRTEMGGKVIETHNLSRNMR